jgi:histidinol phosphatase-like PHP family hydrolase
VSKRQTAQGHRVAKASTPFYQQDLQLQTTYSDGRSSVEEIVLGSIANGRKIIGITDHAIGWCEEADNFDLFATGTEFEKYLHDIETAKKKYREQGVTVLAGLEVEVGLDGSLSLAPGILDVIGSADKLSNYVDYTLGVIHSESFTCSLQKTSEKPDESEKLKLLMQNIARLIASPQILIWGHPSQVIHGQYHRDFTPAERKTILKLLAQRTSPLYIEYNLNPFPRYVEWEGDLNRYVTRELEPNDLTFLKACATQGSSFVVNTDAHDIEQTSRLNPSTVVPSFIADNIAIIA